MNSYSLAEPLAGGTTDWMFGLVVRVHGGVTPEAVVPPSLGLRILGGAPARVLAVAAGTQSVSTLSASAFFGSLLVGSPLVSSPPTSGPEPRPVKVVATHTSSQWL